MIVVSNTSRSGSIWTRCARSQVFTSAKTFTGPFWQPPGSSRSSLSRRPLRTFHLDECYNWDIGCGKRAANGFCRKKGFSASFYHVLDAEPSIDDTFTISSYQICDVNDYDCYGFQQGFLFLRWLTPAVSAAIICSEVTVMKDAVRSLTIEYPAELLWALQQEPDDFENEARLLLATKLYETGRLTTGLAARLAGVPRSTFIFLLQRYGLSPFGEDPDEVEDDLANARRASYRQ